MPLPDDERAIISTPESALKAPGVPRETVNLYDDSAIRFGFSAEELHTIIDYLELQSVLANLHATDVNPAAIAQVDNEVLRDALSTIFSVGYGTTLDAVDLPTTIKVLVLNEVATHQIISSILGKTLEVWVNPELQQRLQSLSIASEPGLNSLAFSDIPAEARVSLVNILNQQYHQAAIIRLARQRFPDGVSTMVDFGRFLQEQDDLESRISFGVLVDLDEQYRYACLALQNPWAALNIVHTNDTPAQEEHVTPEATEPKDIPWYPAIGESGEDWMKRVKREDEQMFMGIVPSDVDEKWQRQDGETLTQWRQRVDSLLAEALPRYQGKTIYDHFDATTPSDQETVFNAFWRHVRLMGGNLPIVRFGEEEWLDPRLYLEKDGHLAMYEGELSFGKEPLTARRLTSVEDLTAIDKAVTFIRQELDATTAARARLQEIFGNQSEFILETNLLNTITLKRSQTQIETSAPEEADPEVIKAFSLLIDLDATTYTNMSLHHMPEPSIQNLSALHQLMVNPELLLPINTIRAFFTASKDHLYEFRKLFPKRIDLYAALDLTPGASANDVKQKFREIVRETAPIQKGTLAQDDFDQKQWQAMNHRYQKAVEAYHALQNASPQPMLPLGELTRFFDQ